MRLKTSDYAFATVAYADIFGYPLTPDEAYYWFIKKFPRGNVFATSIKGVQQHKNVLFLKGRQAIVEKAIYRRNISKKKWEIARATGKLLQRVPTVCLVGVTGGVSVHNANKRDDIDLFFVASKGTLWITRLFVILVLDITGRRRRPKDTQVSNKICINMFMSEDALRISKKERDLFCAHEVLQMEPLSSRNDTYQRFLKENTWVEDYLPVAWGVKQSGRSHHPKISHWYIYLACHMFRWLEVPAKIFQLWYMRKRRSSEVISGGVLRFHPNDARHWIKSELAIRLAKNNIPLDNIFYDR